MFTASTFDWSDFALDTGKNVFWNFADIYDESKKASAAIKVEDYAAFGLNAGKIVSDVFVKNPNDYSWVLNNSDVFMALPPPSDVVTDA